MMNMTKLFCLLVIFTTLIYPALAQDVKGNGNVVRQERNTDSFSAIDISGVFHVYLTQGDTESVFVEADENLLDLIETINQGSKLVVRLKKGVEIKKAKRKDVHITLRNIDELEVSGVVHVESTTPITAQQLELNIGGVSNTDLDLRCDYLDVRSNMVGSLTLRGSVKEADIENNGVGSLKAFDLQVDKLTLRNSGVGSAEVTAQEEISINASGIGSVRYKGDPIVKELESSGLGKVKKQ